MDQDLARDAQMYNAMVHVSVAYTKPKKGVFKFIKTRSIKRKDSMA